jgi:hypothetical protein
MEKIYKVLCLLLLVSAVRHASAQSAAPFVFNATGGSYDDPSSYYRFEWSIGELTLIDMFAPPDSALLVTQGVLQPCTEKIGLSYLSTLLGSGEYRLFPNPTAGKFELDFFIRETGIMEIQLTDSYGKVLERRKYEYPGCCRIEYFDISRYPAGTYYVITHLTPNPARNRSDGQQILRHSGIRVIKIKND